MPQRFPFTRSSSRRSSVVLSLFTAWIATCLIAPAAHAQIWTETGDAGELPFSAQITVGTGPLTQLDGSLIADSDADMYCIRVTDPVNFRASLQCVVIQGPDIRIFNSSGIGVSANFLCQAGSKFVSGAFATTVGTYYLTVSYRGWEPVSAGPSSIWLATNLAEHAPDGPGAAGAIIGWAGPGVAAPTNPYRIILTGAGFCDDATPTMSESWGALKLLYR